MSKGETIILLFIAAIAAAFVIRRIWTAQAPAAPRLRTDRDPVNAPVSPGWSEHDAQTLRGYLVSDTGRRFILRLQATEYSLAVRNAGDVMHTAHSAGITAGYGQCIKHVQSLAHCGEPDKLQEVLPTEEGALAELERRYAP